MDLLVRDARLHPTRGGRRSRSTWESRRGVSSAIRPGGTLAATAARELNAGGRLLSPPLVDPHVHLDAVLTVGEPRHNDSGTLIEGILTWADASPLTHKDVKDRARQAILWEVAQGTGLIRSHVDVCDPRLVALKALLELRDEMRDVVDLRLIAFPQDGILSFPDGKALMREAMRLGCDVIGGIPHYEWTRDDGVDEVHFLFELSRETGTGIDLHCDETDDEQSRFLEVVAADTMRRACRAGSWPGTRPRWARTTTRTPSSCSRSSSGRGSRSWPTRSTTSPSRAASTATPSGAA